MTRICKRCEGKKKHKGMGGMPETCKLCNGTGKIEIEPVVHADIKKKVKKDTENRKELI